MPLSTTTAGRFVALCWVIFAVAWIGSAFFTKRTAKRDLWWNRWVLLAIAASLVFRPQLIPLRPGMALWPSTPVVGIVADTLVAIGLVVALWARAVLGMNWSWAVVLKEQHELIERGPYRVVRHPIYSGVLLMVLGTVILWSNVSGMIPFGLCLVGLSIKARREERLLTTHFPDAYLRYRARVRSALIPYVI